MEMDAADTGTKIQIRDRPSTKGIFPFDKLSSYLFSGWEVSEYMRRLNHGIPFEMAEGKIKNEVVSVKFWLELLEGYEDKLPPDARHREILFVCMSLYEKGYREVTFDMIIRALTGGSQQVSYDRDELREILRKLIFTGIRVDVEPLKKFPKYRERLKALKIEKYVIAGALLPAKFYEASVNGQKAWVLKMLATSPLRDIAQIKQQLIEIDTGLLAIPGQHDAIRIAVIKQWLLRRIMLSDPSRKKPLNRSILFETIFEENGFADANKNVKQNIRKLVIKILEHFKASGVMQDFEIVKSGRAYRSITITFRQEGITEKI